MKSFVSTFLAILVLLVASCSAFQAAPSPRVSSTSLAVFGGKKKPEKKDDTSFLAGRGARITIREDEDAAMWIEEPKDTKKKGGDKGKPKKKGWFG